MSPGEDLALPHTDRVDETTMTTSQPSRPGPEPAAFGAIDDEAIIGTTIHVDDDGVAHGGRQRHVPVPVVAHALVPRVQASPAPRTTIRRVVADPTRAGS
jgi:hypothetical protein